MIDKPVAFPPVITHARLVRDFVCGKQYGVNFERYGSWYVFSRGDVGWLWQIAAGPFVDETAALAWIECLEDMGVVWR
jgi:hypothetical protein